MNVLKDSGPVPGEANGERKKGDESSKKKKRPDKGVRWYYRLSFIHRPL